MIAKTTHAAESTSTTCLLSFESLAIFSFVLSTKAGSEFTRYALLYPYEKRWLRVAEPE